MKKLFPILYLIILQLSAKAQTQAPVFNYGDTSFSVFMLTHVKLDDLPVCNRSLVLVRFKIDPSGAVTDISFSKGADSMIRAAISHSLETSDGKWKPGTEGNTAVLSEYLILPCFVAIERGCTQAVINAYFQGRDQARQGHLTGDRSLDSLRSNLYAKDHSKMSLTNYFASKGVESMADLFVFDDGELRSPMNCRVLEQVNIISIF